MNLLLDAHAFLWWMVADSRLSESAHELIEDAGNRIFLSTAAAWEIVTKHRLGRLPEAAAVIPDFAASLVDAKIDPLPVALDHAILAGSYATRHRDPFDRIIAAQAQIENMAIVTTDRAFRQFPVRTLW